MSTLAGKIALVTGGGTGIGRGIAAAFAEAGATVVITSRRAEVLAEACAALGPSVRAEAADVSEEAAVEALAAAVVERHGGLDILVNNAGVVCAAPVWETSCDDWDRMFAVNVRGPFLLCRAFAGSLKARRGAILNISSTLGSAPIPQLSAYSASKAALDNLTRSLALELAPFGVRANAISPAVVDTPIHRQRFAPGEVESALAGMGAAHPLGRVGQPADIAAAALYLCSPQASWVTGVVLPVDGGMLIKAE